MNSTEFISGFSDGENGFTIINHGWIKSSEDLYRKGYWEGRSKLMDKIHRLFLIGAITYEVIDENRGTN